ncbi:hypothetical protein GCM10009665_47110 [Kitasatospora nipponensis]|uniref:Cupin type-2 domain-containing protein n=1 Tax=Kitasatospora nipponensis TaxID=258049 RepID=A0ABN1WJW0_9ACTN
MTVIDLLGTTTDLPHSWRSRLLAEVGTARVKVLRMDELPVEQECHAATEVLLVLDGRLELLLAGRPVTVRSGELVTVPAGCPHAVRPGSSGTLVIVETAES